MGSNCGAGLLCRFLGKGSVLQRTIGNLLEKLSLLIILKLGLVAVFLDYSSSGK